MNQDKAKLDELEIAIAQDWYGLQPVKIERFNKARAYFTLTGYRVGLPLWWARDDKLMFAGIDWLEPLADDDDPNKVNRIIERGKRERIETITDDEPLLIFKAVE